MATNYYAEFSKHRIGQELSPEQKTQLSEELERSNPLAAVSKEQFIELLELIDKCNHTAFGRLNSKTKLQFHHGLQALKGDTPSRLVLEEAEFFEWEGLAHLEVEPVVAFAYRRLRQELLALKKTN